MWEFRRPPTLSAYLWGYFFHSNCSMMLQKRRKSIRLSMWYEAFIYSKSFILFFYFLFIYLFIFGCVFSPFNFFCDLSIYLFIYLFIFGCVFSPIALLLIVIISVIFIVIVNVQILDIMFMIMIIRFTATTPMSIIDYCHNHYHNCFYDYHC